MEMLESKAKALKIAEFASGKKANNIVVLDVSEISGLCDYFVICSAESAQQVEAISRDAIRRCRKDKLKMRHFEKDKLMRWVLVDFFDVILHVFLEEARSFYNLEYLWSAAKKVPLV
ncbi:MAG: ribosome silencing factor [Candidatus Omnitrophota bacterium]